MGGSGALHLLHLRCALSLVPQASGPDGSWGVTLVSTVTYRSLWMSVFSQMPCTHIIPCNPHAFNLQGSGLRPLLIADADPGSRLVAGRLGSSDGKSGTM